MRELSSEIDAAESLMAELADEYVERLERGDRPDIDDYVARWPGDPLVLRQAMASLKLVRLSSLKEAGEGALEAADASGRLGDFQLLREIGRGGMGVVYEAEQRSLGRRVALKLLPLAGMLDPRQLQRFKNEALAAAQLNHPNIVDVIAVGCERGVHYYAMRLIDGLTLAEVITALKRSRPSESDEGSRRLHEETPEGAEGGGAKSADAGEELQTEQPDAGSRAYSSPNAPCEGNHHAERDAYGTRDVLGEGNHHAERDAYGTRDLEPAANPESTSPVAHLSTERPGEYYRSVARLLADAADALDYAHQSGVVHRDVKPSNLMLDSRGKIWITDFGLARVESNTEMTMTGDLLGTLRYMSPEQASGDRRLLDHRTDVYSLGATFYELLTLRPAFVGSDRRELLRQIAEAEPVAPRKVRRSIPPDLETIAGKALEKDPSHRYVSAGALAADLRCFLAGQPIRARSLSRRQRIIRWTQRHVGLVYSVGAVLAVALLVSTIAGVSVYHSNQDKDQALDVAEGQRRVAVEQRRQADDALRLARRAVDRMYTDVATEWLAANGALTGVQEKFLSEALQFYEEFPNDHAANYETRLQAANTHLRIGELRCQLMKLDEAEQALATATLLFERLVAELPGDLELRKYLARVLKARAVNLVRRGATKEAVAALDRAVQIMRDLVTEAPGDEPCRFELTSPEVFDNYLWCGKYDEGVAFLADARQQVDGLIRTKPRRLAYLQRRVELDWRLADVVHWRDRDFQAAEAVLKQALELDRPWVREEIEYPLFRWHLAFCADTLGRIYWATDRLAEAEDALRLAVDIRAEVARRFPHDHIKVHTELLAHRNLAVLLDYRGKHHEADAQWREELIGAERIAHLASPESSALTVAHLIEGHRHVAESALRVADQTRAEEHALKMLGYFRRMPAVRPGTGPWLPDRARWLVSTYAAAGRILASLGKYQTIFDLIAELAPQSESGGAQVGVLRLSECLARAISTDERLEPLERSELLASALAAAAQCLSSCDAEKMLASDLNGIGWFLATTDVPALRDVRRSLVFAKSAVRRHPDNRNYLNTLGAACYQAGHFNDARTHLLRCLELDAPVPDDMFLLAMIFWQLGDKEQARHWFDQGASWRPRWNEVDYEFLPVRREAERLLGIAASPADR